MLSSLAGEAVTRPGSCFQPPPQPQQRRLQYLVSVKYFLENRVVFLEGETSIVWVILNTGPHRSIQPKTGVQVKEPHLGIAS